MLQKTIHCDPKDPNGQYYLPSKKCDGYNDCSNGADESWRDCNACDVNLTISGNLTLINGEYYMGESSYNDKPYYKRVSNGSSMFLFAEKIKPDSRFILWKGLLNLQVKLTSKL